MNFHNRWCSLSNISMDFFTRLKVCRISTTHPRIITSSRPDLSKILSLWWDRDQLSRGPSQCSIVCIQSTIDQSKPKSTLMSMSTRKCRMLMCRRLASWLPRSKSISRTLNFWQKRKFKLRLTKTEGLPMLIIWSTNYAYCKIANRYNRFSIKFLTKFHKNFQMCNQKSNVMWEIYISKLMN